MGKNKDEELYKYIPKASEFLLYTAATIFVLGPLLTFFLGASHYYTPSYTTLGWWEVSILVLVTISLFMHRGMLKIGSRVLGAILLIVAVSTIIALYH